MVTKKKCSYCDKEAYTMDDGVSVCQMCYFLKQIKDKGEAQYKKFVEKIGLDYSTVLTPQIGILDKMGRLNKSDKEFIILAIEELHNNFFTTSINIERRRK